MCVCVLLPTLCKEAYLYRIPGGSGLVSLHFSLSKEKIQCVLASRPQGKGVLFASSLKVRVIGRFFFFRLTLPPFLSPPPSLPLSPSLFFCLSPSHVCALKGDVCYWTLERRRKTTTKTFFFHLKYFLLQIGFSRWILLCWCFSKKEKMHLSRMQFLKHQSFFNFFSF